MSGFLSNPVRVQSWYSARSHNVLVAEPHAGHYALAELERIVPRFTLVTQNVDGMHTRAGNRNVVEIHGSLLSHRCVSCGRSCPPLNVEPTAQEPARCECGGLVRPSVIWFGEMLDADLMERATNAATDCDVFISVGTGAEVYPAASLPLVAADNGAYVVEVNPVKTVISDRVDESIRGRAGTVLPALVGRLAEVN
jgi:NAD-dependent deacetylase